MTPLSVLAACVVLTWLSRAALSVLLPPTVVPDRVRQALPVAAPTALAALVSTDLAGAVMAASVLPVAAGVGFIAAAAATGLAAFRTRSMLLAVLSGIAVAATTTAALPT